MVADRRVVTDVVPAPEHDVVADARERLDRVVLEHEAVLADLEPAERRRSRADVARERVPPRLRLLADRRAEPIDVARADGNEELVLAGRVPLLERLVRNDGDAAQLVAVDVVAVDGEGGRLAPAVLGEQELRAFREGPGSEDDERLGYPTRSRRAANGTT